MKKRILSFLMALLMVVSIIPFNIFAEGEPEPTPPEVEGTSEPTTEPVTDPPCDTCGAYGCGSEHLTWCADCRMDDCGQNHCPTCGTIDCTADHGAPAAETHEEPEVHPMVDKVVKLKSDLTSYSGYRGENLSPTIMGKGSYPSVMKVTAVLEKDGVAYCRLAAVKGSWSFQDYDDDFYLEAAKLVEATWCADCKEYECGVDHSQPTDPTDPPVAPEVPELDDGESGVFLKGTFPTDVSLSVKPADVSGQLSQFGVSGEKLVFGLDISLMRSGVDYQPGAAVRVKVPVSADVGTKIGILHTHGGETTYMGLTEVLADGTVEFTTDRFSTFAGFTVDFHYNEIDYSIGGLTSIKLSELFVALEIDRNAAHVIDVTYSDPSQIEVTQIDGDWQLESLKAFDTEETLEITFYDGEIITIDVTDDAYPDRNNFTNHNSANDAIQLEGEGLLDTSVPYRNFSAVSGVESSWSVWAGGKHNVYVYLYDINGNPVDYSFMTSHPASSGWLTMKGNYWYEVTDCEFAWPDRYMDRPIGAGEHTLSTGYCGASTERINWVEVRMYSLDVWDNKSYCDVNQVSKFALDESGETGYRTVVIYAENNEVGRTSVYMPTFESISTSDLTVSPYAGWTHEKTTVSGSTYSVYLKRVSYTISYTLNGGQVNTSNPTTYNVETNTFTLNNPTKNGYTFTGWTGTDLSSASTTVTISKGSTGDRSYTANWEAEPVSYTVTWVYGNGTENTVETVPYGAAITKPADPTRTGYNFTGWSPAVPATMPAVNQTFTAQWEGKKYKLTVYATYGQPNTHSEYEVQYGTDLKNNLRSVITTPAGFGLKGLYTQTNSGGTRVYDANAKWLTGTDYWDDAGHWKHDGDLTVYADWESIEYTITYVDTLTGNETKETYTISGKYNFLEGPSHVGYDFGGWKVKETVDYWTAGSTYDAGAEFWGLYGNVTLETVWTPIEYTITYDLNGGTLAEGVTNPENYTIETQTFTLNNPTKPGYKFKGWATSADATTGTEIVTIQKGTTGEKTFCALWERSLVDLTITATTSDRDQNFIFTVSGSRSDGVAFESIDVVLCSDNSFEVTIKDMPVGEYTVTEKSSWSWRESDVGSQNADLRTEGKTVSFGFGSMDNLHWLSDYSYRKKGGS